MKTKSLPPARHQQAQLLDINILILDLAHDPPLIHDAETGEWTRAG